MLRPRTILRLVDNAMIPGTDWDDLRPLAIFILMLFHVFDSILVSIPTLKDRKLLYVSSSCCVISSQLYSSKKDLFLHHYHFDPVNFIILCWYILPCYCCAFLFPWSLVFSSAFSTFRAQYQFGSTWHISSIFAIASHKAWPYRPLFLLSL